RDTGARSAHRLDDLFHGTIEEMVIIGLEPDADLLVRGDGRHGALLGLDLRDHARPHRPAPLPNRKPQLLLHRDRRDQLDRHRHVVPRHHHLHPRRQRAHPRHVRRPKVKLRPIPVEKRRVPPPLLLRQHVHFRLELLERLDRPRLRQHLPAFHLVLVDPPQQRPDVVPRPPFIQQLAKHLHPPHHALLRLLLHPHDLDLFPHLHHPALHPPRHHRPPPRDRENVLDRHQKRLVHRPRRRRYIRVHRLHQLPDALGRHRVLRLLHRPQRTAPHHRYVVPRKLVLLQQLPHLQLHQIQDLRIVHHVALVHEHHQARHIHLPRQQHVLPRLRHRPVIRRHHQDRPIHLGRPRDHVLDVVRVPRTIDVRVVPVRRLVLHVAHRNRDPPLPLLRCIVDRPKVPHRYPRVLRVQHLRDRTRQRRLAVIDMPDRPDVHVRLRPIKLLLGHRGALRGKTVLLNPGECREKWSPCPGLNRRPRPYQGRALPTELHGPARLPCQQSLPGGWSGKRDSNPRPPAWKAGALPLSYSRLPAKAGRFSSSPCPCSTQLRPPKVWWGEEDLNLRRLAPADLQSAPFGHLGISPLAPRIVT